MSSLTWVGKTKPSSCTAPRRPYIVRCLKTTPKSPIYSILLYEVGIVFASLGQHVCAGKKWWKTLIIAPEKIKLTVPGECGLYDAAGDTRPECMSSVPIALHRTEALLYSAICIHNAFVFHLRTGLEKFALQKAFCEQRLFTSVFTFYPPNVHE